MSASCKWQQSTMCRFHHRIGFVSETGREYFVINQIFLYTSSNFVPDEIKQGRISRLNLE